ncbi:unnamed protein product [Dovyalis caffra]|uniref:Uncharacterized protein n=1 Tax=Dovyalis caffra TaxID=77055 RepID=A0AAV1SGT2_9ROSI|nr:unnamed protein product [Dovyalis caffra]
MDPLSNIKPYGAAMIGDWKSMIDHYHLHFSDLLNPVTSSQDTALHIAVCSQKEQPLKALLALLPSEDDGTEELENTFFENISQPNPLKRENKYGNTVLHEATIYGNFEAVKLLVERYPDLVTIANVYGETPLFTAAEFADPEIVKFLLVSLSKEIVEEHGRLKSIHRQRPSFDNLSILSAAILGQHYETAVMLLELDESLHKLEDNKGATALQILANSPSAFKSGYPINIYETLLYCCTPSYYRSPQGKIAGRNFGAGKAGVGRSGERSGEESPY